MDKPQMSKGDGGEESKKERGREGGRNDGGREIGKERGKEKLTVAERFQSWQR